MAIIYKNMDLDVLELRIGEKLKDCSIWGDLNLAREEYEKLNNKIIEFLNKDGEIKSKFKYLMQMYPKVVVTHIVNYTLFDYDGDNFWLPWENKLNVSIETTNQGKIGTLILENLNKYGFGVWEDDGLKYITPIICQSGIPTPCFEGIFDILEGTLNDFYFSPYDLLSDINGKKYYKLEKGAERFFRLYPEKSADLLNSIRTMIQTFEDNMSVEDAIVIYSDLSPRIVEKYADWVCLGNNQKYSTTTKLHYSPPRLYYNDDGKGVSIFLPEQTIKDEYIFKLTWKIFYDECKEPNILKTCPVLVDSKYSYINNSIVPIDIAKDYCVELWSDDNEIKAIHTWQIHGIQGELCLLFDKNGRIIKADSIQFNSSSVIVLNDKIEITDINNINLIPIGLPGKWAKLKAYIIIPIERHGYMCLDCFGNNKKIVVKYSYSIKLISNGNLFREEYSDINIPVYIRWPRVQIGDENDIIPDIDNWEIRCKLISTGEQVSGFKGDFGVLINNCFDLDKLASSFENAYSGKYEIKVYQGRLFKKSFLFYKSPYIESSDILIKEWPSKFSNLERTGFKVIDKPDKFEMDFNTNVKIDKHLENQKIWNQITTNDAGIMITGTLKIREIQSIVKIPFQKTVRKMKWSFWNEIDNEEIFCRGTNIFYLDDFELGRWWLTIHICGNKEASNKFELIMETHDRHALQMVEVKLNQSGNFSLPMNSFSTTIENNSTPMYLMFHYTDEISKEDRWICLSSIRERIILKNIKYTTIENGEAAIFWDVTNKLQSEKLQIKSIINPNFIKTININRAKINKKNRQYILFNDQLEPGIYTISPYEVEDDFLLDESDFGYSVFEYNLDKIIRVDTNLLPLNKEESLYDWLVSITIRINSEKNLSIIESNLKKKYLDINVNPNFESSVKLIFSYIINNRKGGFPSNSQKKLISIFDFIINEILGNEERGQIIPIMLRCNIAQDEKEILIQDLGLYRFSIKNEFLSTDEIRFLWDVDRAIAALWVMKAKSFDNGNIELLVNFIGTDFFKDILILKTKNPAELDWNHCLRALIQGGKVSFDTYIKGTSEIWGDTEEFIDMFDFGNGHKSKIVLNNSRRRTTGKMFSGNRYIDLLIEWYRNIDGNEEINNELKITSNIAENIQEFYDNLETDRDIVDKLVSMIYKRKINHNHRYLVCYYSAYYALFEAFHKDKDNYNMISIKGNEFFRRERKVFLSLHKRDILMAEVYSTLIKERGALICQ